MQTQLGFRWAPAALAVGFALMGAGTAYACPGQGQGHSRSALAPRLAPQPQTNQAPHNSIVGLWQLTYTSGGSVWDMSFDTYHADGTENDNDMSPPSLSSICEGVWEMIGPRTIKLHHVGWVWDPTGTILLGVFSLDEINTLSNDGNSYSGVFTFQNYDTDWNPIGPPTPGTTSAVRISVH